MAAATRAERLLGLKTSVGHQRVQEAREGDRGCRLVQNSTQEDRETPKEQ